MNKEKDFFDRLAEACYGRPVHFLKADDYLKKLSECTERHVNGLDKLGVCSVGDEKGIYILC